MDVSVPQNELTPEYILALFKDVAQRFQDTDKQFKEAKELLTEKFQDTDKLLTEKFQDTDKKFQDTDKLLTEKFQDTDKKFRQLHKELGGIGKSNGEIAEDFFFSALEQNMQVSKLKFDYVDRNIKRTRNNTRGEYDIILYNNYKVMVIEVKYNFRLNQLHDFYKDGLKRFRSLYQEYKEYKLYGAIAALTYDKDVIEEAKNYGLYVLSQNNDKVKVLNEKDFLPNDIK